MDLDRVKKVVTDDPIRAVVLDLAEMEDLHREVDRETDGREADPVRVEAEGRVRKTVTERAKALATHSDLRAVVIVDRDREVDSAEILKMVLGPAVADQGQDHGRVVAVDGAPVATADREKEVAQGLVKGLTSSSLLSIKRLI